MRMSAVALSIVLVALYLAGMIGGQGWGLVIALAGLFNVIAWRVRWLQ